MCSIAINRATSILRYLGAGGGADIASGRAPQGAAVEGRGGAPRPPPPLGRPLVAEAARALEALEALEASRAAHAPPGPGEGAAGGLPDRAVTYSEGKSTWT